MHYQLQEFSYRKISFMQEEFIPWDLCSFIVCWSSVWDQCHTMLQLEHPGKTVQGNRRLGGQRERQMSCLVCLWAVRGIVLRTRYLWELKLCIILRYFHLYDNIYSRVFSWGFPQSILMCFMYDWFFFSIICVLFDLAQID